MTDLAVREPSGAEVAQAALSSGVARIMEWAESARAAHSVATSLVGTSFVPEAFRGKPHEATAAILAGAEVGLSPMASLRSFDIIQGTAAARAITLRAVVQSHGHEVWVEESTATRAVVCGQRRGSGKVEKSTWTIDRAKQLGLTGKKNWQGQPQAMLVARGTSEVCRLIASDAILGIGYSAEEIEDSEPTPTITVERKTTRQRATAPVVEEPPLEPDPAAETPARPDPAVTDMITSAQLKKIGAAMTGLAMTDRTEALAFVSDVIGRDVTTRNDLTKDEASRVIDRLEWLETNREPAPDEGAEPELTGWNA